MRLITDSNAIFNVEINPYLQIINVKHIRLNKEFLFKYGSLEETFSHKFDWKYDFHFLYDGKLTLDIYLVDDDNNADYNVPIEYNLDVVIQ